MDYVLPGVKSNVVLHVIDCDWTVQANLLLCVVDNVPMLDFEMLARIGLTQYERQALIALLKRGVADAAALCEEGEVPTSKIYQATEKLEKLGLISVQRSRPRQFAALSPEAVVARIAEIAHEEADRIAADAKSLVSAIQLA